jgi:hypothetical protein
MAPWEVGRRPSKPVRSNVVARSHFQSVRPQKANQPGRTTVTAFVGCCSCRTMVMVPKIRATANMPASAETIKRGVHCTPQINFETHGFNHHSARSCREATQLARSYLSRRHPQLRKGRRRPGELHVEANQLDGSTGFFVHWAALSPGSSPKSHPPQRKRSIGLSDAASLRRRACVRWRR